MKEMFRQRAAAAVLLSLLAIQTADRCRADTLKIVYPFQSYADGYNPVSNVIFENGMMYGSTRGGGTGCSLNAHGCGTLFQIDPATGSKTVLHSFLFTPDGGFPESGPVYANGKFYGATPDGGAANFGAVYEFDPAANTESVVASFNDANGSSPYTSPTFHNGILYGVATHGGAGHEGVIYSLDITTGNITVLYNFMQGPRGYLPDSSLLYHDGSLYGTTTFGGSRNKEICYYGCGTLFKFNLATQSLTVLFGFKERRSGGSPVESPVIYQNGALYGVTQQGGAIHKPNCVDIYGCGVVYKFDLASNTMRVLYRFTGRKDGTYPIGGLVYVRGYLYGTTANGGDVDRGTIYKVNAATGAKTLLHSFSLSGADDGNNPFGGMTYYRGRLYGTTTTGGDISQCDNQGCGTVFEIKP